MPETQEAVPDLRERRVDSEQKMILDTMLGSLFEFDSCSSVLKLGLNLIGFVSG